MPQPSTKMRKREEAGWEEGGWSLTGIQQSVRDAHMHVGITLGLAQAGEGGDAAAQLRVHGHVAQSVLCILIARSELHTWHKRDAAAIITTQAAPQHTSLTYRQAAPCAPRGTTAWASAAVAASALWSMTLSPHSPCLSMDGCRYRLVMAPTYFSALSAARGFRQDGQHAAPGNTGLTCSLRPVTKWYLEQCSQRHSQSAIVFCTGWRV